MKKKKKMRKWEKISAMEQEYFKQYKDKNATFKKLPFIYLEK